MPEPLRNEVRTGLTGVGFLKNPRMANARMPQSSRWDIATGELAHWLDDGCRS
jgi:hypothetical protein